MLKVKKVRTEKHISKYMLSKLTGITRPALTKIENGGDVKLSTLHKIAEALDVDVVDLFERSTNNGKV
jgi:DNA-binding Xre family transcriptional regulator